MRLSTCKPAGMLADAAGTSRLTEIIIRCAIAVHRALGPGLLEKPYKLALANELLNAGLAFELDVQLTATYRGDSLGCSYYMDIVVENLVVLEIKSVTHILPVHRAQLLTYLKLSGHQAGLILNFNTDLMKDGIARVLNDKPAHRS
jgi:GxxExxY protein